MLAGENICVNIINIFMFYNKYFTIPDLVNFLNNVLALFNSPTVYPGLDRKWNTTT